MRKATTVGIVCTTGHDAPTSATNQKSPAKGVKASAGFRGPMDYHRFPPPPYYQGHHYYPYYYPYYPPHRLSYYGPSKKANRSTATAKLQPKASANDHKTKTTTRIIPSDVVNSGGVKDTKTSRPKENRTKDRKETNKSTTETLGRKRKNNEAFRCKQEVCEKRIAPVARKEEKRLLNVLPMKYHANNTDNYTESEIDELVDTLGEKTPSKITALDTTTDPVDIEILRLSADVCFKHIGEGLNNESSPPNTNTLKGSIRKRSTTNDVRSNLQSGAKGCNPNHGRQKISNSNDRVTRVDQTKGNASAHDSSDFGAVPLFVVDETKAKSKDDPNPKNRTDPFTKQMIHTDDKPPTYQALFPSEPFQSDTFDTIDMEASLSATEVTEEVHDVDDMLLSTSTHPTNDDTIRFQTNLHPLLINCLQCTPTVKTCPITVSSKGKRGFESPGPDDSFVRSLMADDAVVI